MAQDHSRVVTTSVGFGEAEHNELSAAELVAAHCGTSHHPHLVEPKLEDIMDAVVGAFDEPFADSSSIPTWYVSREARRDVTVALSGDGGDETFGGYDFRYIPHAAESRIRSALPGRWPRRAVGALGRVWPRSGRIPRYLRLGTFLENIGRDDAGAYYADLCFMKPRAALRLLGRVSTKDPRDGRVYEAVTTTYRRCPSKSPVQRAQYADLKVYLPNDVLVKVDRMSMLHGLEVRCPLLDRRLVELAFSLPQSLKRADRTSKYLLREVARRRLPDPLLRLPKHGFTAPIGVWMRGPYRRLLEAEVFSPQSRVSALLDIREARALFERHVSGNTDHSYALWAIWVLERWLRQQRGLQG
jgi:asparagine synthase (glutamine-hydrolysing)